MKWVLRRGRATVWARGLRDGSAFSRISGCDRTVATKSIAVAHKVLGIFMDEYLISLRRASTWGEAEMGNFGQ